MLSGSKVILRRNFFMFFSLYIHFSERKALRRDSDKQSHRDTQRKRDSGDLPANLRSDSKECLCRTPLVCPHYPFGNHAVSNISGREPAIIRYDVGISIVDSAE